jgi:hypothetical protein
VLHKDHLNYELSQLAQFLNGTIWLLEHCNHTGNNSHYPHHVRDRISESLVEDIRATITTLSSLQSQIDSGIDNEGKWDGVPF